MCVHRGLFVLFSFFITDKIFASRINEHPASFSGAIQILKPKQHMAGHLLIISAIMMNCYCYDDFATESSAVASGFIGALPYPVLKHFLCAIIFAMYICFIQEHKRHI
jgi:hypothetical protein